MLIPSTSTDTPSLLPHGGRLRIASTRYGIPLADWLDLSTGINPNSWPVPALPTSLWSRLPEEEDGLEAAARDYYGTPCLLPVAGSQAAIQMLPSLFEPCHVGMLQPSYEEHAHAWQRAGHTVTTTPVSELHGVIAQSDVVVLVNPNNPTGTHFTHDQLLTWHENLAARGGSLIVDEAFIDATPEKSLAPLCSRPGLIVLRSLGKFFGLAGARVGFVCAEPALLERLKTKLGPWAVTTASRWIATRALDDHIWQETARKRLAAASTRLAELLQNHELEPQGGCVLFQWVSTPRATDLHHRLARTGILTRLFDESHQNPSSMRFGLPRTDADWERLDVALADVHASRGVVEMCS